MVADAAEEAAWEASADRYSSHTQRIQAEEAFQGTGAVAEEAVAASGVLEAEALEAEAPEEIIKD